MSIVIDKELCTGCEACVSSCPSGGIEIEDGIAHLVSTNCNLCVACVDTCSLEAITLERVKRVDLIDKSQYHGVWIIAEHFKKEIQKVVYQLLGKGRELADILETSVSLILLGDSFDSRLNEFGDYGADEVIYVKSLKLNNYYSDLYVDILCDLVDRDKPEIILIGATPTGRDYAPRMAKRLGAGLTADCTGLEIEPETGNLLQTRPTYGGTLMATIKTPNSRPQMATVRPGIFKANQKLDKKAKIKKIDWSVKEVDSVTKILKIIDKQKNGIPLEDAKIIVAGGRGVGSKENFKMIEELAEVLGAELGGSRVTVELNWLSQERQIGQTGKNVTPKLYIACGISGAIQHLVGMQNSEIIVAINRDPNAPIFGVAHYGIVADLREVVPELIKEIKRMKNSGIDLSLN